MPAPDTRPDGAGAAQPVLRIDGLHVSHRDPQGDPHPVLNGADLTVGAGSITGVIGESGSGKTTLARAVVGLVSPAAGTISLDGRDITRLRGRARRALRRSGAVRLVFQDPLRSLDPDLTAGESVAEGPAVNREGDAAARRARAAEALVLVGLDPGLADRRPGQLSGGQRQRVAIARALVGNPRLLLCDEPVSALDAAGRGQVLRLLGRLRDELGLAIVVISHDLPSMAGIADRIAVLHEGRFVEEGPTDRLLTDPRHPYTQLLLDAAPRTLRVRIARGNK
ncbi:ATP-binding cassette domain-containing protein [Streptomyces sp. NPDC091267]|uniref:ABC transporter ATP-binding protein n=1 Tax=Streptomyces sp. NPDC091267 TaxID=3155195 RepID=UPI00342EE6D9